MNKPRNEKEQKISKKIHGTENQRKTKIQFIEKLKIHKNKPKKLNPVERFQKIQADIHESILDTGMILIPEYIYAQQLKHYQKFKERENFVKKLINFKKIIADIRSNVKIEYEQKLLEFTRNAKENFDKAVLAVQIDVQNKFEERLKQHAVDVKSKTLKNIEKMSTAADNILRQEFEFVKQQNLEEFQEYYCELLESYNFRYEKHLDEVKEKNDEEYDKTKKSLENEYRKALDSAKEKLQNELLFENPKPDTESTVVQKDETNPKKIDSFENPYAEKIEKLKRTDERIQFCKKETENVLNDYANLIATVECKKSRVNHVIDIKKMIEKYKKCPTAVELEELMLQDEECV